MALIRSLVLVVCSLPVIASASDLSRLKACVSNGYKGLTNRNAIVAAVLDFDSAVTMTFGEAKEDQLFEIGSITKTFTANLLAQSIASGKIRLPDPIPSIYQKTGSTITYQELATHTSGVIAGIFPDFKVTNPLFPFEGLTISLFKDLYERTRLESEPGTVWSYSNIGTSLLGLILAESSGMPYEQLVSTQILKPLGMNDSYFEVPKSEVNRFPTGFMIDPQGNRITIPHWDLYATAIGPAGGLRSTIHDMVLYTRAHLSPPSTSLRSAIELTQKPLYLIKDPGISIGMNWILQPDMGLIWHNGQTFGFNSILAISTKKHQAVIAMTDSTVQKMDAGGNIIFDMSLQEIAFNCLK